jgi:hypothetical protein
MSKTTQALDQAAATLISKFDSRKFLVFAGAFLVSLSAGLAGVVDGTTTIQAVLVAAIGYGISEAIPDLGGALSDKTVTTRNVTASASDKETVQKILAPVPSTPEDAQ